MVRTARPNLACRPERRELAEPAVARRQPQTETHLREAPALAGEPQPRIRLPFLPITAI